MAINENVHIKNITAKHVERRMRGLNGYIITKNRSTAIEVNVNVDIYTDVLWAYTTRWHSALPNIQRPET